jgi:hypothetical protein
MKHASLLSAVALLCLCVFDSQPASGAWLPFHRQRETPIGKAIAIKRQKPQGPVAPANALSAESQPQSTATNSPNKRRLPRFSLWHRHKKPLELAAGAPASMTGVPDPAAMYAKSLWGPNSPLLGDRVKSAPKLRRIYERRMRKAKHVHLWQVGPLKPKNL